TAASGVVHEEFHGTEYAKRGGPFEMIQLWVNLPRKDKMSRPGYQGIRDSDIPRAELDGGAGAARLIAGSLGGVRGPARTFTPMDVWDVRLNAGKTARIDARDGDTTAVFVLRGSVRIDG